MRLGKIKQLTNEPAKPSPDLIALRLAQVEQRRWYAKGIEDGVLMALDHLEGKEAGGVPYTGELPDELRTYLRGVRERLGRTA